MDVSGAEQGDAVNKGGEGDDMMEGRLKRNREEEEGKEDRDGYM